MSDTEMLNGIKVLAVDDEPDILEVLEELLDMCQVTTASTFDQAKALLESQDFDVVILDVMGVDGHGLANVAQEQNIPAVMLTAHAFTAGDFEKTVKEGALSFIPKEEIHHIADYLVEALSARQNGTNPWVAWQRKLPSSYFEQRWGAAWKKMDKGFLDQFRDNIKKRNSGKD